MKGDVHFIPVFTNEYGKVRIQHANLDGNEMTVRSIGCIKKCVPDSIPIYFNGRKLRGNNHYWIDKNGEDVFEVGIDLTKNGLK